MKDNQELTHLDALFRQTFEDLPDTPSPSGWDTPSPRVWEDIRTHLQTSPRSGGGSFTALLLAGTAFVALLAALYWAFLRPTPPPEAPVVTSALHLDTPAERTQAASAPEAAAPAKRLAPWAHAPKSRNTTLDADRRAEPLLPSSAPLPGSMPAPNTTIRREVEALRHAPWAQPLQPLPTRTGAQHQTYPPDIRDLLTPQGHKPE
jgi:hypothetical protein